MKLTLRPNKVFKFLIIAYILLLVGNLLSIYFVTERGFAFESNLIRLLNFDLEQNMPTFFSTSLLLISSILLLIIGRNKASSYKKQWLGLSLIFFYLSLDEAISLHEILIFYTRKFLDATQYLYFAWVIPYSIIVVVLAILYGRWLMKIPRRTSLFFILAGVLFISGAIGMELLGGNYAFNHENFIFHPRYLMLITIEESLEMLGLITFIYGLLDFMVVSKLKSLKVKVAV